MPQLDIEALRRAVAQNRYVITAHARQRMGHRRVTDHDGQWVAATGSIIEEYPTAQPFSKAPFMAYVQEEPLYVSCAFVARPRTSSPFTGMIQVCGSTRDQTKGLTICSLLNAPHAVALSSTKR